MKSKLFNEFTGLNVQRIASLSDEKTSRVAKNVYLSSAKKWITRPGSKLRYVLPDETRGLYVGAGVLRSVAPDGDSSIFNEQRPNLWFDFVNSFGMPPIDEFIAAEPYGASIAAGVQVYGAIKRGGITEHHWFRDRPDTAGDTVDNRISLPFTPSGNIVKAATKAWAIDQANGAARFCSTQFGPEDWLTADDAGFLPVLTHAAGDRAMTALGTMQSTPGASNRRQAAIVVYFEDGIQVWAVDEDPLNHYLTNVIDGPGTTNRRSVVNALGNPVFFSRNGFRSLRLSLSVGAMDTATIGHPIEPLTEGLGADEITAALWWDTLGAYLAAVGSTIYCWRYDPLTKTAGWSLWEMPWTITDMADLDGSLWVRTDQHEVHEVNPRFETDNGSPIQFELETQFHHLGSPGSVKTFDTMQLFQQGTCTLSHRPEPTIPDVLVPIYEAEGVTRFTEKIPILATTDSVALRFEGVGPWQLDGYTFDFMSMGM